MTSQRPEISVVMGVHNGAAYLAEAIESVLRQTFEDFEFVIVDDASTDETSAILESYRKNDHRVIVLRNARNLGLTQSLNLALERARGRFIARMDADDMCCPRRLTRQLDFMARHPDVDVAGSWVRVLRGEDSSEVWKPPVDHPHLVSRLCFQSALYHPSAFIRRESGKALPIAYDPSRRVAQDYDLWARLALDHGARLANVPEVLLVRRVHAGAIGEHSGALQQTVAADVRRIQLNKLGIEPSAAEMELHNAVSIWRFGDDRDFLQRCATWLKRLRRSNDAVGLFPRAAFYDTLDDYWFAACRAAAATEGRGVWLYYAFSRVTPLRPRRLSWLLIWCVWKISGRRPA